MRQTPLIQQLFESIRVSVSGHALARVTLVRVRVGPLAGVDPVALRHAFDAHAPGGALEGARLELATAPVTAWCRTCMTERPIEAPARMACPVCGQPTPDLMRGADLELDRLEFAPPAPITAPADSIRPVPVVAAV